MWKALVVLALFLAAGEARAQDSDVWTLYRASVVDDSARVHVATFDSAEPGEDYNKGNCETAAELFADQPGVTVRYWCEKVRPPLPTNAREA